MFFGQLNGGTDDPNSLFYTPSDTGNDVIVPVNVEAPVVLDTNPFDALLSFMSPANTSAAPVPVSSAPAPLPTTSPKTTASNSMLTEIAMISGIALGLFLLTRR